MSKQARNGKIGLGLGTNRTKKLGARSGRRLTFESLEFRRLLSVAAPASIVFQPQTGQGIPTLTSANNSSQSKELEFLVSGVTAGDTVNVFADGNTTAIGTATVATGATTAAVTTDGVSALADGSHTFTATQTDTSGSVSSSSPATSAVQVFTGFRVTTTSATAVSATVGKAFTYQFTTTTNAPSGDSVTISQGTMLPGMSLNPATQTVTGWTPTAAEASATQVFSETLTDTAGNSSTIPVFVAVSAASGISVFSPPTNMVVGSPVLVAVNDANSGSTGFKVSTSSSSDPTGSDLTATFTPASNPVLKIVTNMGEIDLQLLNNYTPNTVAHIESLVESGIYTNSSFYRIVQDFVIQGGTGGTGGTIPVELNPDLRFTSSGLLAMANNGVDGNSSEFFITGPDDTGTSPNGDLSDGFLDFRYTIFGKVIAGDNVRQAIASLPVTANSSTGEDSQPLTPPVIESMSITTDPNAGVFLLKAATGASGTYTVTVSDGTTGSGGSQSFTVTVGGANPFDPPNPWVVPINGTDTISIPKNQSYTFDPVGESAAGSPAPQVNVQLYSPVSQVPNAFVDGSYIPSVDGQFELEEGTSATTEIPFSSEDLATTASNIQTAIDALTGLTTATVTAVSPTKNNPSTFSFQITLPSGEASLSAVGNTSTATNIDTLDANLSTSTSGDVETLTFTYAGLTTETPNPGVTLTANANGSYTLKAVPNYNGVQYLEITAVTPVTGTFELQVGSATTQPISFDSTNPATTANNMQTALDALSGVSATVTAVVPLSSPTDFSFDVTFASAETPITYVAASTALPVSVTNSALAATTFQILNFNETAPGNSWDASSHLSPVYRSFIPIFIGTPPAPAAPKIASISVNGATVTGSTVANNSSSAEALTFHIAGANAGGAVSVYMDGSPYPLVTGSATTSGQFELAVGSATTGEIGFNSSDLTTTAENIQGALQALGAGFTNATVSVASTTAAPFFTFNVAFSGSEPAVTYVPDTSSPLPISFTNSVAAAAASQQLTFEAGVTTNGITQIPSGSHVFTVKQASPEDILYSDWSFSTQNGFAPGAEYAPPASAINSPASAGTTLSIGLALSAQPSNTADVGSPNTFVVQTNAPIGDAVSVHQTAMPAGMTYDAHNTFTWTPTSAEANTSPDFAATVTDTLGNTVSFNVDISVIVGLPPIQIPVNASKGGNVTVFFSGNQVEVYDAIGKTFLSRSTFKPTDTVAIDLPAGQANSVLVLLPSSAGAALPLQLLVEGAAGSTNNAVIVYGTSGANTFTLSGNTATANGLATKMNSVQTVTLAGHGGNDYYHLNSSSIPSNWIVDTGGYNTVDFSQDSGAVNVNLGLDKGQAQSIAPWGAKLSVYGVMSQLIGSAFADVLTGGRAATTMIRAGAGNAIITGGSGNNVLIGGGGNDSISGGAGNNLLIAGAGKCSLYAKGAENIVIAGSTNIDANDQALLNLLAQGPSFMYGYMFRRALASAAANPALQSSLFKFEDSGAADIIYGSSVNSLFVRGKNDTVVS